MPINPQYLPPDVPAETIKHYCRLVSDIEASPPKSVAARELIASFNASVGKDYEEQDFREYHGSVGQETFVKEALLPMPQLHDSIQDSDFIQIIERLTNGDCDEAEQSYWIRFLAINLQCAEINDIIYWSDDDPDAREVVARAKKRKRNATVIPTEQ